MAVHNTALEPNPERLARHSTWELVLHLLEANPDAVQQCNSAGEYPLHLVLNRYCSPAWLSECSSCTQSPLRERAGRPLPLRIAYANLCSGRSATLLYAGGGDVALISTSSMPLWTAEAQRHCRGSAHIWRSSTASAAACAITLVMTTLSASARREGYLALHGPQGCFILHKRAAGLSQVC